MRAVLRARGLRKSFGDVVAVDGLDLDVHAGEVVGLLGHNGAGKTTTVRLLNGLLRPDAGTAQVLGLDPWSQGPELRARTGVLTEVPALEGRLSARETLMHEARVHRLERAPHRISKLLEDLGLADRADEPSARFSKGMSQRLALARAFLTEPSLLFLDEPVASLDPVGAAQVHELIRTWASERGHSVVLATHNLFEAERLCDRVTVLERGRVLAEGTVAELVARVAPDAAVHVEVAGADRDRALGLLAAGGVEVRGTREGRTLEDVYFALHEPGP